jgi:hypothetical protein
MKTMALAAIIALFSGSPALAWFTFIQVAPSEPHVGEAVTITVVGYMPDSCWEVTGGSCSESVGNDVTISVATWDCVGRNPDCEYCLAVLMPFQYSCIHVFDTVGTHLIRAHEYADSLYPVQTRELTYALEVGESVAVEATAWSAVKSLYR